MNNKRTRHHKAILTFVRESLREHGARDTESIREAMTRFLAEHRAALQRASEAEASAEEANARAAVADRTRDAAQAQSNEDLEDRLAACYEVDMLRREVEMLRRENDAIKKMYGVGRWLSRSEMRK
jgi:hypothetical protein